MSLYDIRQNQRIAQSEQDTRRAARHAERSQEAVEDLEKSVKQLSLVCKALWQLLQENCDLPDEYLQAKIKQIETETTDQATHCTNCGRVRQNRMANCLYCGTAFTGPEVTDQVFGL